MEDEQGHAAHFAEARRRRVVSVWCGRETWKTLRYGRSTDSPFSVKWSTEASATVRATVVAWVAGAQLSVGR